MLNPTTTGRRLPAKRASATVAAFLVGPGLAGAKVLLPLLLDVLVLGVAVLVGVYLTPLKFVHDFNLPVALPVICPGVIDCVTVK
jgi:hypothetical protein